MANIIKSIHIENFRGIKNLTVDFDNLNVFIGDNGTNKTSIIEAIHYAFSPSFLSGRIKSTDFYEGTNDPIKIVVEFVNNFRIQLPDGYTTQEISCNKISLTIKKRERKSPGKVLSDLVTIEHIVVPTENPKQDSESNYYWEKTRQSGSLFRFNERLLSFNVFESEEIPRSFYFGKERDKQLLKGYNTSFSSILEDLNWRFLKKVSNDSDFFKKIDETEKNIIHLTDIDNHDFIRDFNSKITEFKLDPIEFSFIERASPFEQAFLSKKYDKLNLSIKFLGSGIEMIYALLLLETLASLSKENLLIIIDEPELHLHPNLQQKLAEYLYNLSQNSKYQIFITTHSPIFFKTLVNRNNVRATITKKQNSNFTITDYTQKHSVFPWGPTWGEINYFAYDYPTVEFHNELYGYLQEITSKMKSNEFDDWLNTTYKVEKAKKWTPEKGQQQNTQDVTLMTFIRHKIHHPENKTMQNENYSLEDLKNSTEKLIEIINHEKSKKITNVVE